MGEYNKMSEQDVCPHTNGSKHHVWNMVMLLMRRSEELEKMQKQNSESDSVEHSILPSTDWPFGEVMLKSNSIAKV
jgi:hypothetical protein